MPGVVFHLMALLLVGLSTETRVQSILQCKSPFYHGFVHPCTELNPKDTECLAIQKSEFVELGLAGGHEQKYETLDGYVIILIKGTTENIGPSIEAVIDLASKKTNRNGFFVLGT